jgi:Spy/CpxP family protein refolding chaperone
MKAWIIAAVVAGALVLVGVPAVALALGLHTDTGTGTSHAVRTHDVGPDGHHRMWKHGQGWDRRGFGPGKMHRHFAMHRLNPQQRAALADRLDQRAGQLHKAASCLRGKGDAGTCLKRSFSPRPPRG